jgi:penicillin-binding protein 1A
MQVGPAAAMEQAARLGVRSPLQPNPASVLGTNDVTAMDMASAYATFANRGVRVPPVLVTKISRADGTILYLHRHSQTKVLDAGHADTISAILQQAIERGTGRRATLDRPAAGKTGTAQEYRDAWFVGYTPELSTAVWVGFSQAQVSMQPPATPIRVFGGTYPAEIWQRFMSQALTGRPTTEFQAPSTTTTSLPFVSPPSTARVSVPTAVPAVVGLDVDEAIATLQAAGFRVVDRPAPAGAGPPGRVVAQSPSSGQAPRDSIVTIEVAV